MAGTARVTLVGNLGKDPETKYTTNGKMNVSFSMAVSRRFTSSGETQERTYWYRVTAWGALAETLDRLAHDGHLVKGKQVYVEGRFEPREWTTDQGEKRTSLDVTAAEVLMLGQRSDGESHGNAEQAQTQWKSRQQSFRDMDEEELPF